MCTLLNLMYIIIEKNISNIINIKSKYTNIYFFKFINAIIDIEKGIISIKKLNVVLALNVNFLNILSP